MANNQRNGSPGPSKSGDAVSHDSHGTPFKRVPGPGPKDGDKGAAGQEAMDRVEGGPEHAPDQADREADENLDQDLDQDLDKDLQTKRN